ncbi:hypothetical protein HS1genome_1058 [Sulfodiicoccus acidiphilus]|uniref:Uncharacterized protein n=1 Tax=Sulfodiicoccus acidiphilus TaxID=1670455 RepID=A0A348B3B7_9CREN|nr:hypothetical protein [Sulfodiicoccus acidiphilus]BBD72669.1 hypothetical protein HS1genome_1058 [Sulfodiicoccus acidiphilus]GGT95593.1 hypothetical protein GCM10007116_11470 [Sulfodiicoccus acidiphilus]
MGALKIVLNGDKLIINNSSALTLRLLEVRVGYRTSAEDYAGRPTTRTVTESTMLQRELKAGQSIELRLRSSEVSVVTLIYSDGKKVMREDLEP